MTAYDFQQQLAIGASGEKFLDTYFAPTYDIREASRDEQRSGIDRHFRNRSSDKTWTVEYKTDWTAGKTHNAFIETVSVDKRQKSGWAYTSRADVLVYYVPGDELIYVIEFSILRRALPRWSEQYRTRGAVNSDYTTYGLIVPLHEFERIARAVFSV